jgi:hypothetical protein
LQTPSDQLVEIFLPLLVQEGLVLSEDSKQYKSKIAAGTMKAEDWLLAAQKALDKKTQSEAKK